jgi:peptidoglycan/LPS O-acetylase OafA/YrhL
LPIASSRRIPEFDGIRAVAVTSVMMFHVFGFSPPYAFLGAWGWFGVDIFFVLSGFLITRILIEELESTGSIAISRFYSRRAFRLYPTFITALILTMVGLLAAGRINYFWTLLAFLPLFLTYTLNIWISLYFTESMHIALFQAWSLCIEEQFYLVWPWALRALGRRRGLTALYATVAISVAIRVAVYLIYPHVTAKRFIFYGTLTRLDGIGIGCILALTAERLAAWPQFFSKRALWLYSIFGVPFILWGASNEWWYCTIGSPLMSLMVGVIITAIWLGARGGVTRFLACAPMVEIGRVSYGIYLFESIAIFVAGKMITMECVRFACILKDFAVVMFLSLALAELHYRFVEQRCMALRDRLFDRRPAVSS